MTTLGWGYALLLQRRCIYTIVQSYLDMYLGIYRYLDSTNCRVFVYSTFGLIQNGPEDLGKGFSTHSLQNKGGQGK